MPVIYNSKMIIPGPMIDIRKEVNRDDAGNILRQFYTIQAQGTLVAYKGSPNSSGTFHTGSYYPGPADESIAEISRLASLRGKMKALNDLFCEQGMWFEVQPFDGSQSLKFQPRIRGINFARGKWFDRVDYTIDMEADSIFFGANESCGLLSNVVPMETWSIEAADQIARTYRLTHMVSSQQKNLFDASGDIPDGNYGWQRARAIVLNYLGIQNNARIYNAGVLDLSANYQAYNYFRSQQIDENAGKFTVNETWLVYDPNQGGGTTMPPALDDFTVQSRVGEDGITIVSMEGSVTGLEVSNPITKAISQTRWQSAVAYFNGYVLPNWFQRAEDYADTTLNPVVVSSSIGRNPVQGTISYSVQYSDRRNTFIPGAVKEDITLQYAGGTDIFATVPVLGRPWGPVLQDLGTISERTLSINISAQMQAATMLAPTQNAPSTDGIVIALAPTALQVFRPRDDISWSPQTGRFSRSVQFVYQ